MKAKRNIYLISSLIIVFIIGCTINSCNEKDAVNYSEPFYNVEDLKVYEYEQISEIVEQVLLSEKTPQGWWEKIKIWIKAHSGNSQRYKNGFPQCDQNHACGPCAGICPFGNLINGEPNGMNGTQDTISRTDYLNGYRVFSMILIENEVTKENKLMLKFTDHIDDFVDDSYLYIPDNLELTEEMIALLEAEKVVIQSGVYAIVYEGNEGYTVVEAEIVE